MTKVLRITMPDGSEWDVPAEIIANSRATYYAEKDAGKAGNQKYKAAHSKEFAYTMENDAELTHWAENNMNWEDVKSFATKHKDGSTDYEEGWANCDKVVLTIK